MKALGIVGSPRKGGNTETITSHALKALAEEGIETELIPLAGLRIQGCTACGTCCEGGDLPDRRRPDAHLLQDERGGLHHFVVPDLFRQRNRAHQGPDGTRGLHRAQQRQGLQGKNRRSDRRSSKRRTEPHPRPDELLVSDTRVLHDGRQLLEHRVRQEQGRG
ncbi:MAG: flavodoxin family protein [Chloroflexi bacterium]|nr:flavodoxin family protein [Chloroflexota bacterium]